MSDDIFDDENRDASQPSPPSKSQRKREATALQEMGEQLVRLTVVQLSRTPLPDDLRSAVRAAQGITQRGGRKRQLQYIGKLMRRLQEPETAAIRAALSVLRPGWRS